ncbi:MAG TPA: hypothetical protein VNO14_04270, partial [Blastocatellia bacterium]|nr:hypothetical protein [Blastocatellia bacterium]
HHSYSPGRLHKYHSRSITAENNGGAPGGIGFAQGAGNGGQGGDPGEGGDPAPSSTPNCGVSIKGGTGGTRGEGPGGFRFGNNGTDPGNWGADGDKSITARSSGSTDDDGDGFSEDDGDCDDGEEAINPDTAPCCPGETGGFCISDDMNCNGISDSQNECANNPIIINFSGNLRLTSPSDGVAFDIRGNGTRIQLSWTRAGSDDSFLALDRNGNGTIDNGGELFGNHTRLGNGRKAHNGFEALAWYDLPANGGNGNAVIDAGDSIYSSLKVWQDMNHNGTSEPNELRTLSAAGIEKIEIEYRYSMKQDKHGNEFRYRAKVFRTGENDSWGHNRFAYDVFLSSE